MSDDPFHISADGDARRVGGAAFDELVAQCIDVLEVEGPEALHAFLRQHPAESESLRRRLAMLSRHGLLTNGSSERLESVGPYRLIRRLGAGGMGEVHLAEHGVSGCRVALKLGPARTPQLTEEHQAREQRAAERFERETRAVATIAHPAIVPILDRGVHDGRSWFAMEYVRGVGLDRLVGAIADSGVSSGSLSARDFRAAMQVKAENVPGGAWFEAVGHVVLQVAEALARAHAKGVIHRDVKPSNVLVCADGSARLVDFGLAHFSDLPTLTLSGEFAGTPYYVAPEQIASTRDGIDGRADVFSLGVTLYECVSLVKPFPGRTPTEVLAAISGREPPLLRKVAPHLPYDLELLCRRALEKDPQQRYPSMGAFCEDLRRLLSLRPLLTKPPSPRQAVVRWARRRPWRAASAGLAGVLLIGAPIGLLSANAQIRRERDRVVAESNRKDAVVEHLVGHFDQSGSPEGVNEAARELLRRGVERLEGDFGDQPQVRAALLHASGRAFLNLGLAREARPLLDRAFALWQHAGPSGRMERARVLADIARVHLLEGRPGIARDIAARALAHAPERATLPGATVPDLERARATLAAAHVALGATARGREELQRIRDLPDSAQGDVALVWESIGRQDLRTGAWPEAQAALERALSLLRSAWTPDPDALASVHDALALVAGGRDGEASADATDHAARAARLRAARDDGHEPLHQLPFLKGPPWEARYTAAFDRAIAALQAERLDEARRHFEEALAQRPIPAVAAYNLACVEARRGQVDDAIRWLKRARLGGFACVEGRADALRHDADLESVRGTAAGRAALRALLDQWDDARAFATRAVVRVPDAGRAPAPASEPATARPLLVVLHPDGSDAVAEAERGWQALAEGIGAILLVPSAPYLVGATSTDGAQWSADPRALFRSPDLFVSPVLDQVGGVLARYEVDRDRVWIAGRGMGALLALELMAERPGLFRGGLLVDPILHEQSGTGAGALPAALGNRLGIVISESTPNRYRTISDPVAHAAALTEWLVGEARWRDSVRLQLVPRWQDAATELLHWIASQ